MSRAITANVLIKRMVLLINSRYLLLLFGLAFLTTQIIGFSTNITSHDQELEKLGRLVIQVENGAFFDLKVDPKEYINKENKEYRNSVIGFIIKAAVIISATIIVYIIILRKTRGPEENNPANL